MRADVFNTRYPPGTSVIYAGRRTTTRSMAWELGAEAVVLIEGVLTGVAIRHLDMWPEGESDDRS